MTDHVELWVWSPIDVAIDYSRIKEAKAMLGIEALIHPHVVTATEGDRVLAIDGRPPFLCDYFLISNGSTMDVVAEALGWALDLLDDERATEVADTLSTIFGAPVHEVTPEELESEQAWQTYKQS